MFRYTMLLLVCSSLVQAGLGLSKEPSREEKAMAALRRRYDGKASQDDIVCIREYLGDEPNMLMAIAVNRLVEQGEYLAAKGDIDPERQFAHTLWEHGIVYYGAQRYALARKALTLACETGNLHESHLASARRKLKAIEEIEKNNPDAFKADQQSKIATDPSCNIQGN